MGSGTEAYDPLLSRAETAPEAPQEVSTPVGPEHRAPSRHADVIATYVLLGSAIRVHYGDARLYGAIHPLLRHSARPGTAPTDVVDIVPQGGGVAVIADDRVIGWSWALEDATRPCWRESRRSCTACRRWQCASQPQDVRP